MPKINFDTKHLQCTYRESFSQTDNIFENHCHLLFEMIGVFEGSVSVQIEGTKYTVMPYEAAFIPPLTYHSISANEGAVYKRITFLFDQSFIPEEIQADFMQKAQTYPVVRQDSLKPVLTQILQTFQEEEGVKYAPLLESLLVQIFYIHTYKDIPHTAQQVNPTLQGITEYIHRHICEKISLDDIAGALFLSKSTVCHLFKEQMNISVKQYILQKKMTYAAKLIQSGMQVSEAAHCVGYDNYTNFYKIYCKVFQTTPTGFKHNKSKHNRAFYTQ